MQCSLQQRGGPGGPQRRQEAHQEDDVGLDERRLNLQLGSVAQFEFEIFCLSMFVLALVHFTHLPFRRPRH